MLCWTSCARISKDLLFFLWFLSGKTKPNLLSRVKKSVTEYVENWWNNQDPSVLLSVLQVNMNIINPVAMIYVSLAAF